MEILMTESYMYLLDIKLSLSLTDQKNNRKMYLIRLNLLTKPTWKLKTPGGLQTSGIHITKLPGTFISGLAAKNGDLVTCDR